MTDPTKDFATYTRRLLTYMVGVPILLFWAGLSVVPLGRLFTSDLATLRYWINAFFLCSGLWGALLLYFGAKVLMWPEARDAMRLPGGAIIIGYAFVWSVLFLAFYISSRSAV